MEKAMADVDMSSSEGHTPRKTNRGMLSTIMVTVNAMGGHVYRRARAYVESPTAMWASRPKPQALVPRPKRAVW